MFSVVIAAWYYLKLRSFSWLLFQMRLDFQILRPKETVGESYLNLSNSNSNGAPSLLLLQTETWRQLLFQVIYFWTSGLVAGDWSSNLCQVENETIYTTFILAPLKRATMQWSSTHVVVTCHIGSHVHNLTTVAYNTSVPTKSPE